MSPPQCCSRQSKYALAGRGVAAHQIRNDLFGQEREYLWIAEETGDIDEQVLGEQVRLVWIGLQYMDVVINVVAAGHRHCYTSIYPALQRSGFVECEIICCLSAEKVDDFGHFFRRFLLGSRHILRTADT